MFISIGSKQNIALRDQLLENEGLQASRNQSLGVCFPSQTDLSDVTLPEGFILPDCIHTSLCLPDLRWVSSLAFSVSVSLPPSLPHVSQV